MIPLGLWLQERSSGMDTSTATDAPMASESSFQLGDAANHCKTCEEFAIRAVELEAALADERKALEAERVASLAREEGIREKMGGDLAAHLAATLNAAVEDLHRSLEGAVLNVLMPFVRRESAVGAAQKLVEMVRDAIADTKEPLISVSAPEELHDKLKAISEHFPVSMDLRTGDDVEVIFQNHSCRFEVLARRWIEAFEDVSR